MSDLQLNAAGWTKRAIQEIGVGEASDARQMLAAALQTDPRYEPAWLWFATLSANDGERRYCYEQALAINPESPVGTALSKLPPTPAILPPELADFADPPLPEEFGGDHIEYDTDHRIPKWAQLVLGTLLALFLGGLLGWFSLDWRESNDPVFIAFVSDFEGPGEIYSREMEQALLLYFDLTNSRGGINGHDLELLVFNDGGTPETAIEAAKGIVADDRILAVVGHRTSTLSLAAGPIYAEAGIPVLTGTASADAITDLSEWHFRTIFDNSAAGAFIAAYVGGVLKEDRTIVVVEDNVFGSSLASRFVPEYEGIGGEIVDQFLVSSDLPNNDQVIADLVSAVSNADDDVVVFVAANADASLEVINALRTAGLERTIVGTDAIASSTFLNMLVPVADNGGNGSLYAASPLITDSLTGDMLNAYKLYFDAYGDSPTWRGLSTIDVGITLVRTMDLLDLPALEEGGIAQKRAALTEELLSLDSPDVAIPGLLGPIYFDENRTVPRSIVMGVADGDDFRSAPLQLSLVQGNPEVLAGMGGDLVSVGDVTYAQSRVVYTGVEINEIRDLNTTERTFFADFYLWFKFIGDENATDIIFPNKADVEQFTMVPIGGKR